MKELESYYVIELTFALRHYIEHCDAKGMLWTSKEMQHLLAEIRNSRVFLQPFNT